MNNIARGPKRWHRRQGRFPYAKHHLRTTTPHQSLCTLAPSTLRFQRNDCFSALSTFQHVVSKKTTIFPPCPLVLYECAGHVVLYMVLVKVDKLMERVRPGNEESMIRKKFLNKVIKGCLLLETVTLNVGARASGPFQCHYETARLGDVSSVQECHRCQPQVFRVFFHRTIHSRKRWFGYGFPSINRKTFLLLVLSSLFSNFFQLSYFVTT
jgi:hypothetical protein